MIAITHPIKKMINSQYGFLSSMLDFYPSLMNEWIHKQEVEVRQLAELEANGDTDVYLSILNTEMSRVDSCYDEEQLFNQAMLIMVYSYYESTLLRLAKEIGTESPRPSILAANMDATLDDELLRIAKFLFKSICPLRNQLCHNNSGTLYEKSNEEEIANIEKLEEKNFISIDEGKITSIDRDFIKKTLDGEYKILIKLAEICGFKTNLYGYNNGKFTILSNLESTKR